MIQLEDLNKIPILSTFEEKTQNAFVERAFRRKLHAGATLLFEGDPADACYFIASGHFRVLHMNPEGRIQVLARLTPGSPINLISLLNQEKVNLGTVEALTTANVLVLSAYDFEFLMSHFSDFSKTLLFVFAERLKNMTQLAAGLSLYPVKARLARFLMDLADTRQIFDNWTQDEIAAQIGTVRDVVGRLLREFENQELIKRDRHQILLLERKGLTEIANQIN
jgi:CRP-like cAMP-binding protein